MTFPTSKAAPTRLTPYNANLTPLTSVTPKWTRLEKIRNPTGWRMTKAIQSRDKQQQVALLSDGHTKTGLKALLEHLRYSTDPVLQVHAQKLLACRSDKPCHARGCPRCSLEKRDRKNQIRKETKRSLSKDPQARSGQRASIFHLFPENEVWVMSINLEPVPPEDIVERIAYWRTRLHDFFDDLKDEYGICIVQGRFEDDPFRARDLDYDEFAHPGSVTPTCPNTPLMKLHLHCLVHVPENTSDPIKDRLVKSFGPGRITDLRSVRHTLDEDDIDLHGIEGFARYMSKEFVDLSDLQDCDLGQIDEVLKSMFSRTRTNNRFDHGLDGIGNDEGRSLARWIKRCRDSYDIPPDWSFVDIENFLLDWDICELIHHYPSNADALDDMRLDYEASIDSNDVSPVHSTLPSYQLYARAFYALIGKIASLGWNGGRDLMRKRFARLLPSIRGATGPPI